MAAQLVRIEPAGPDSRARRLIFDDDSTRTTSAAALKQLGLDDGATTIDDATLEAALDEIELPLAKERALGLLGYRERTCGEVARKLRENGYPSHVVNAVVARFSELELIDDARFARSWSRSRASAGYGRRRVARELAEKGVDKQLAEDVLGEVYADSSDDVARARSALRGATATTRKERDRLLRRLISRGFDMSTALQAINFDSPDQSDTA